MKRQVFLSFNYNEDYWRASQIMNMGIVQVNEQIQASECTVVLVGQNTANNPKINQEIIQSWVNNKGVVGIHVHGLIDHNGIISGLGENPFDYLDFGEYKFSQIVRCYNPPGISSRLRYDWISRYLSDAVEEAIRLRGQYT